MWPYLQVLRAYGQAFQRRIRAMGIRDRPISPRSPWQNPCAERLIGTLRRECLDHVLIVGEWHLRRMLASYSSYYNETRTHLALEKDAPLRRAIQKRGAIITTPILSGLTGTWTKAARLSANALFPAPLLPIITVRWLRDSNIGQTAEVCCRVHPSSARAG